MAETCRTIAGMKGQSYRKAWHALPHEPGLAMGFLLLNVIAAHVIVLLLIAAIAFLVAGLRAGGGSEPIIAGLIMALLALVVGAGAFGAAHRYSRHVLDDIKLEDTK
jgi:hypothetical protein